MQFLILATTTITFLVYGADKLFAKQHKRRISEITLLFFTFLGGSLGALLGMIVFRHKISKKSFLVKIGIVILVQIIIIYFARNIVL